MDLPSPSQPRMEDTHLSFLDYLSSDPLFAHSPLDAETLQAVCDVDAPAPAPAPVGMAATSFAPVAGTKRVKEELDANCWCYDEDEECLCRGVVQKPPPGRPARRPKPYAPETDDKALSKACREKARRERTNEKLAELARLLDPKQEPRTDKLLVLTDAVKHITQLSLENQQLKQLNKFLEERCAQYEKERMSSQSMYQQCMMAQHGMVAGVQPVMMLPQAPPGLRPPTTSGMVNPHYPHLRVGSNPDLQGRTPTPTPQPVPTQVLLMPGHHHDASTYHTFPNLYAPSLLAQHQRVQHQEMMAFTSAATSDGADGTQAASTSGDAQAPQQQQQGYMMGGMPVTQPGMALNSQAYPPSMMHLPSMMQQGPPRLQMWAPPNMPDSAQDDLVRPPAA